MTAQWLMRPTGQPGEYHIMLGNKRIGYTDPDEWKLYLYGKLVGEYDTVVELRKMIDEKLRIS